MSSDSSPSADTFSLVRFFAVQYKVPLAIVSLALLCLGAAARVLLGQHQEVAPVVFETQSTGGSSGSASLQIDVSGQVAHPGVYALAAGSRVDDALAAAGGLNKRADTDWIAKQLNRAAKLTDGGKIYIPSLDEKPAGQVAGVQTSLVNINRSTQAELEALPGIGPTSAQKIIAGRPYQTVEELKTKKILGAVLYGKVKDMLTL